MHRRLVFRLAVLALLLVLPAALAPAVTAQEPAPTGSFTITFYNYIDQGGAWCPSWAPIAGGTETDIYHYWPEFTRPQSNVNTNNYMACWDGTLNFPVGGKWTVHTLNDDGMDVYLDGQLVMNGWYDQGPSLHDGSIDVSAGTHHVIVKYYNRTYGGVACVAWGPYANPTPFWRCPYSPGSVKPPTPRTPVPCITCYCTTCTPRPTNTCYYRVKYGDTLTLIAWKYHTTVWALTQANRLANPNCIYAGQLLKIPNCIDP